MIVLSYTSFFLFKGLLAILEYDKLLNDNLYSA